MTLCYNCHGTSKFISETIKAAMRLCLLYYILIFPSICISQTANHLSTNIGINMHALRDKGMSPLAYFGTGFSGGLSFTSSSIRKIKTHELSHSRAEIFNQFGNSASFSSFTYRSETLYRDQNEENKSRVALGWSNINYLNYYKNTRYGNFSERINYLTTFGASASYSHIFKLAGKDLIAELPVNFQLIGFSIHPSYITDTPDGYLDPENSGFKAFIRSVKIFIPVKSWYFDLKPNLSYMLSSGNAISVQYRYEFMRLNDQQALTQSIGTWYLSIKTKL